MTIHWNAVEQYYAMVLFVLQFYLVCNFGKFISFGLGTVRSEKGSSVLKLETADQLLISNETRFPVTISR